jgi:methylglutaconyl-CoA hydratase
VSLEGSFTMKKKKLELTADYSGETLRVRHLGGGVVNVVLNRPDVRNAFNAQMISEMNDVLSELAATREASNMRILLLTGEGSVFCAGADLNYMREQAKSNEAQSLQDARILATLFYRLASFPTTVISAVRGAAIGGGFGVVCCSDVVLAESAALFATSEVRLGIVPGVISPYIVRKIGLGRASAAMLSGARMTAMDAASLGLVNQVVDISSDSNAFEVTVAKIINEHLAAAPNAVRRTKELLRRVSPLPDPGLFEFTSQSIALARCSDEGQTGLGCFFDKKTPPWNHLIEPSLIKGS